MVVEVGMVVTVVVVAVVVVVVVMKVVVVQSRDPLSPPRGCWNHGLLDLCIMTQDTKETATRSADARVEAVNPCLKAKQSQVSPSRPVSQS